MMFDTVEEYNAEIATVRGAIQRVLLIGNENENISGGSTRRMRDTELKNLETYLRRLRKELETIQGRNRPLVFKAGW
jgi:hypothetical protein